MIEHVHWRIHDGYNLHPYERNLPSPRAHISVHIPLLWQGQRRENLERKPLLSLPKNCEGH